MERHGGDLETESHEDEHHAEKRGHLWDRAAAQNIRHAREIGLARDAENPGDAVNEKAGGERAQDQIFHAGFERERIAPGEGDEDVERHRDQLERDEDHDEIDRGRHPHEAGAGEKREREKLAEAGLTRGAVDRLAHGGRVIDHHDEDEDGGDEGEAFEENGERVRGVERPEAGRFGGRRGLQEEGGGEHDGQADDAGERERAFVDFLGERFDHQNGQSEEDDCDFEIGRADHLLWEK